MSKKMVDGKLFLFESFIFMIGYLIQCDNQNLHPKGNIPSNLFGVRFRIIPAKKLFLSRKFFELRKFEVP